MFEKSCGRSGCQAKASVILNDRLFCGEHAFEAIKAAKGICAQPRRIK